MPTDLQFGHVVTEVELRRYLRHASRLLASVEPPTLSPDQRVLVLRRARHWLRATLAGVEHLLREAEAVPDCEVDDPLTVTVVPPTIEVDP